MERDRMHGAAPVSGAVSVQTGSKRQSGKGRLLCLFGLIAAALALSTQWLARDNLIFDIFSHFTLHYVLAAAAFLIGFFMPRARGLTAVLLIIAGISAIAWWPHYVSSQPVAAAKPANGERTLRLMTFNSWLRNKDWQAVVDEIRLQDPDIVTLQEFGREKLQALKQLKRDYPYSVDCIAKAYCHLAMLSKYPLYDTQTRAIWKGPAFVRARLGKKFGNIYVYGIHATRPPLVRSQIVQMQTLGKHLKRIPGRKIVMGDFNATPFARLLQNFSSQTGLQRITFLPTWPAQFGPFPQLAIDHVFLSPGIRKLREARIGNRSSSDHFPTVVDIAIAPQN